MSKVKQRRRRGVVLTIEGLEKLKEARSKSEFHNNFGERYTYEKLSELTYLDLHTIKKILNRKRAVDKRSIETFFRAFNLELGEDHYSQPNPNKRQSWGEAISVADFLGRSQELADLKQWLLKDKCRLVTILGMGGMGKTSLSIKLGQQIQSQFDCTIWRSLRDAPPLREFLGDVIEFLSADKITKADLPETTGGQISILLDCLKASPCLLIFDNLESLLSSNGRAGCFREGYEEYGELFQRVGATEHKSCLLLTSREKPKQVATLEGGSSPVRTLRLKGLDKQEAQKILKFKGIKGSESEFAQLIQHYEGNALALKVVSTTIGDLFRGNITEFLQEELSVFGDILHLLEQQFERLSDAEKEIIYWLAINREPTSLSQLREDMVSAIPRFNLMEGLESLSRRSLIEHNEAGFTLQSVVMEYVLYRFIKQVGQEIDSQKLQFFRCYALIKATAKDYVRETQIRLILQPVIDDLLTIFKCKKNVESRLTEILATQRRVSPREPGYTAGNIINMFCQMETDLTGYDFSDLCVWQADLRCATLHKVNFQNSDLSKTQFVENFGGIWSVAFSPDGQYLAAGDTKGEIILRQVSDGQPIRSFKGHRGWVVSLDFSPDGKTLASSSCDCTAKLWDVDTGQCLHTLEEHDHEVWSVAFSPDGKTLATGCDDDKARIWNVSTGKCLQIFKGHTDYVLSVVFSPCGKRLFSGSHDSTIKLWDIKTCQCIKTIQEHKDGIRSLSISPEGKMLVSSSNDLTIRLWDIETGKCLNILRGHSSGVWSVAFSFKSNLLASSSVDQTVRLWDIETGKCLKIFQGHSNMVNSVAFNAQGTILASGSYDQTIKLWDLKTYQCSQTWQGYSNQALSVAFSKNGKMLASGGHNQKVVLWDVNMGKIVRTLHEHTNWVFSVAFDTQDNFLVSGSADKTLRLWDASTGKAVKTFSGHKEVIRSIAISPNDQIIASSSEDRTVKLWDVKKGECIYTLDQHRGGIWSIAFNVDGQILASASFDETVKLWNVKTGECIKTLKEHEGWVFSVAFSPVDELLASCSGDKTIRIWDINTGKCKKILREEKGYSQLVAFSNDGRVIASCNQDHNIKLWRVSTGECFQILYAHEALINSIDFAPDNKTLVSSGEDEAIKLWDFESGECLNVLKAEKPYDYMNIVGITGLTQANVEMLKALGVRAT